MAMDLRNLVKLSYEFKSKIPFLLFFDTHKTARDNHKIEVTPLDSQLRDMCQVASTQFFHVYMVIDVDGLPPNIPSQLLDELPGHPGAHEVGGKEMPGAVR
jgi:hypothetical protein